MKPETVSKAYIRGVLKTAQDHLEQYRAYSDEMAKIGRGCSISSEYLPGTLAVQIRHVLNHGNGNGRR
jgi:hypothetical protein